MATAKPHPFMPGSLQTPTFLLWLRRTHGWLGVGGAAIGILFSVTTLLMEHDNFGIEQEAVTTRYEVAVPVEATASVDAFGKFMENELGTHNSWAPANRNSDGTDPNKPGNYNISFTSPGDVITVRYTAGSTTAQVSELDRGFLDTINRLHRAEGVSIGWMIFSDAFTGALIVLSITGFLMWSQLHGGRLLALGLFGSTLVYTLYVMTVSA